MDAQRQDEPFDVVDEQDRVTGQATRGEVHAQNLRHRAVHVIIYNDKGELFLQKRSTAKDKFPGCWDSSCSGHVDAGEDYDRAARRELVEELGYHTTLPLRPLLKLPCCEATGFEFIQIYLLGPTSGPFQLNPHEISEGEFVAPRHIDTYLSQYPQFLAGAFRYLWANHREQIVQGLLPAVPGFHPLPPPVPPAKANPKGWLAGLGVLGVFLSKFKFLGFLLLKLKSVLSIFFFLWFYYELYGWKFAVCFVALIFIHEMGHVLAAKWCGLPVSAPLFIPFFGAMITLKQQPQNAWIEAVIAYGGPFIGGLGCWAFLILGIVLGQDWIIAGAAFGFLLNLFNLVPVPPLDGGRICAGISPWFWLVGLVLLGAALWYFHSVVGLIVIALIVFLGGWPRIRALFQKKTVAHQAYYGISAEKRWLMAFLYVALIMMLLLGFVLSHGFLAVPPPSYSPNGDDTGADS